MLTILITAIALPFIFLVFLLLNDKYENTKIHFNNPNITKEIYALDGKEIYRYKIAWEHTGEKYFWHKPFFKFFYDDVIFSDLSMAEDYLNHVTSPTKEFGYYRERGVDCHDKSKCAIISDKKYKIIYELDNEIKNYRIVVGYLADGEHKKTLSEFKVPKFIKSEVVKQYKTITCIQ